LFKFLKRKLSICYNINELCNTDKWDNPDWLKTHMELEKYSIDKHCFNEDKEFAYRKGWEWTQFIYGINQLGFIKDNAKALCVGAGHEPTLYYLADRIGEVVATDLYGNEAWEGNEATNSVFTNPEKFCPIDYRKNKLSFKNMDGTRLEFPDNSFDIVWSLSSIEHFGSHENAQKSVQEMARVVKPKGIVVVATEFIINNIEETHPEYFTKALFEQHVIYGDSTLKLIEPMNYDLPKEKYLKNPILLPQDIHRIKNHIILSDGRFNWTSIIEFFIKTDISH